MSKSITVWLNFAASAAQVLRSGVEGAQAGPAWCATVQGTSACTCAALVANVLSSREFVAGSRRARGGTKRKINEDFTADKVGLHSEKRSCCGYPCDIRKTPSPLNVGAAVDSRFPITMNSVLKRLRKLETGTRKMEHLGRYGFQTLRVADDGRTLLVAERVHYPASTRQMRVNPLDPQTWYPVWEVTYRECPLGSCTEVYELPNEILVGDALHDMLLPSLSADPSVAVQLARDVGFFFRWRTEDKKSGLVVGPDGAVVGWGSAASLPQPTSGWKLYKLPSVSTHDVRETCRRLETTAAEMRRCCHRAAAVHATDLAQQRDEARKKEHTLKKVNAMFLEQVVSKEGDSTQSTQLITAPAAELKSMPMWGAWKDVYPSDKIEYCELPSSKVVIEKDESSEVMEVDTDGWYVVWKIGHRETGEALYVSTPADNIDLKREFVSFCKREVAAETCELLSRLLNDPRPFEVQGMTFLKVGKPRTRAQKVYSGPGRVEDETAPPLLEALVASLDPGYAMLRKRAWGTDRIDHVEGWLRPSAVRDEQGALYAVPALNGRWWYWGEKRWATGTPLTFPSYSVTYLRRLREQAGQGELVRQSTTAAAPSPAVTLRSRRSHRHSKENESPAATAGSKVKSTAAAGATRSSRRSHILPALEEVTNS